jgi:hypothetical protein
MSQPYWRLGKSLVDERRFQEACQQFMAALQCPDVDANEDKKVLFVQEVCSVLPSMSGQWFK